MSVLFLWSEGNCGGVEQMSKVLGDSLAKLGIDYSIAILFSDTRKWADEDSRISFPGKGWGGRLVKTLRSVWVLLREKVRVNVIVSTSPMTLPAAVLLGKATNTPVISWVHFDMDGILQAHYPSGMDFKASLIYRKLLGRQRNVTFISEGARTAFQKFMGGMAPYSKEWSVIENPSERINLSLAIEKKFDVIFVARLSPEKNVEHFLDSLRLVIKKLPTCRAAIVGDGEQCGLVEDFLAEQKAKGASNLTYFGALPRIETLNAISRSRVLVLSSFYDTWPTVIVEAFSVKTSVVSYDCPSGPRCLLADSRGLLARHLDIEDLAEKVMLALDDSFKPNECEIHKFLQEHKPEFIAKKWAECIAAASQKKDVEDPWCLKKYKE